MMLRKLVAIPVAGAMLSATWVSAQDKENQPKPRSTKPEQVQTQPEDGKQNDRAGLTGDRAGWINSDQVMAGCVAIQNQEELALVTMAHDKLQNDEAKKFAAMLLEQHQAFLTKLEKFAPETTRQRFSTEEQPSQADNRNPRKKDGVDRASAVATDDDQQKVQQTAGTDLNRPEKAVKGVDMLQIQREIAQECLIAAKSEMQGKQGGEIDQCFLGFQIAKHAAMKAQLTVFQRHASPALALVFAEGVATAEKHKNEAESIMRSLPSSNAEVTDRNPRNETRDERNEKK